MNAERPFPPELWEQTPTAVQAYIRALEVRVTAWETAVQRLEAAVQHLTERLQQSSRTSSRPPSSDPPQAMGRRPRREPSGRRPGGQPGHEGQTRALVPVEQVDVVIPVKPEHCPRCQPRLHGEDPRPQWHQVTEIPPIRPVVIEYQLHRLVCPGCGEVTRAELPVGVPTGGFGPRLQAVTARGTVFAVRLSRGAKVARELLGERLWGILLTDRWSAYSWYPPGWRQLCWAHLLRDIEALIARDSPSRKIGEALRVQARQMFHWWHRVRDGTRKHGSFRVARRPIRGAVERRLEAEQRCGVPKTEGVCREILKLRAALWTFVHKTGVEPTNNAAKRAIRPGVLWRKGSCGTPRAQGSRFIEAMMTGVPQAQTAAAHHTRRRHRGRRNGVASCDCLLADASP